MGGLGGLVGRMGRGVMSEREISLFEETHEKRRYTREERRKTYFESSNRDGILLSNT